jgi:nanoRNase/pAp phosphatase (c-di-AMP/oligoRNAs hydrolase)
VLKEQPDGSHKVSLRSKGATDVGGLATRFGGGGHKYAAGFTSELGADTIVAALVEALTDRQGGPGGSWSEAVAPRPDTSSPLAR